MRMITDKEKFAYELARKEMDIGQLAKKSGVHRCTISKVKHGKSCAPKTANKIAKALSLDVAELFTVD